MITYKDDNAYQQLLSPDPVSTMPHPEKGKALMEGQMVQEKEALKKIAEICLNAKKPVIFTPGRIILWTWEEGAPEKARVLRDLAAAIGAEILPIMDVRPDYPQMRTAVEINPYHGDLVIGHNKYDVAVFMAVDCAYADVTLKIIKDGTDIYTIALCGKLGHVDATITLCNAGIAKIDELIEVINEMKIRGCPETRI
ncbi:hypothetical protein HKBW3S44_00589 [Candidatus Hakubella thermalkaliphila]|uniref:Carbon monoxide dehydrogenase n=1 Tax=Candidatus Hakubella thermalkaliphila TaxID=2754717 RepID=A0A6V8PDA1_9ACTN|nr:carbon monoxide dehydrogenase beta subunit family protein [Candidatus Hakubella thermalkaliphila]GFP23804.1 hypothetical protein HKBW3S09_01269 [Candidatus Hakubella thermalkaliphila]GFP30313.1 hypothetical protein HKBW3S34_01234 [Candidatus Hakubella thermalkaliphila]GFP36908.1 hypothetical protein HKBW3S44_00589 [Candidatus Hakubella thermalkaliphila]